MNRPVSLTAQTPHAPPATPCPRPTTCAGCGLECRTLEQLQCASLASVMEFYCGLPPDYPGTLEALLDANPWLAPNCTSGEAVLPKVGCKQ